MQLNAAANISICIPNEQPRSRELTEKVEYLGEGLHTTQQLTLSFQEEGLASSHLICVLCKSQRRKTESHTHILRMNTIYNTCKSCICPPPCNLRLLLPPPSPAATRPCTERDTHTSKLLSVQSLCKPCCTLAVSAEKDLTFVFTIFFSSLSLPNEEKRASSRLTLFLS